MHYALFLEEKKAFDILSHDLELNILEKYEFRGTGVNLIRNFVTKR